MNHQTSDDMISRYRRMNQLLVEWKAREGLSNQHVAEMRASIAQHHTVRFRDNVEGRYGYEWVSALLRPVVQAVDQSRWSISRIPGFEHSRGAGGPSWINSVDGNHKTDNITDGSLLRPPVQAYIRLG